MPARLAIGDILVDKFRVARVIGEGGMGVVYQAEHISLAEQVAVKLLHTDGQDAAPSARRLLREARAAARIKSEHVARVRDFGTLEDGTPFLVMELVDGPNLAQVLRSRGPLPVDLVARYALESCLALAEAHSLGIVHRDIKPSNLIVAKRRDLSELVKVLDFGVAKQTETDQPSRTASSAVVGSPSYMSPEQIRDSHSVDERSDIWSLGVVLYELASCRLPFEAFTGPGVLAAIAADEPTSLSEHRPELDPAFVRLVSRCLEKKREQRFPRVVELAEALAPFTAGGEEIAVRVRRLRETVHENPPAEPVVETTPGDETVLTQNATATTAAEPLASAPPRRSRMRAVLAGGIVLGMAGVAFAVWESARTNRPASSVASESLAVRMPAIQSAASSASAEPAPAQSAASVPPAESALPRKLRVTKAPVSAGVTHATTSTLPSAAAPATSTNTVDYGYRK